jgi:hypothetical protein
MTQVTDDKQRTALLVIDPYNDFISEGSKVWDRLQAVAEANRCVPHMVQVLHEADGRPKALGSPPLDYLHPRSPTDCRHALSLLSRAGLFLP